MSLVRSTILDAGVMIQSECMQKVKSKYQHLLRAYKTGQYQLCVLLNALRYDLTNSGHSVR